MRVLHTADWHLGRGFHGASLADAHAAVLDHIVEVAASERPDAVVVAGDVFDRAYPPLDAVELYEHAVARIAELGVQLVITSGNHDSAIRLGMHAGAARAGGVHIRTRAREAASPVVVDAASGALAIYPIPYLDPPTTAAQFGVVDASHQAVLGAALAEIRADLAARPPGTRSLVMAHAVVAGGEPAAAADGDRIERSIDVGGVSAVPPSLLAGFDYVALGHLHRPQRIGSDRVRYSGAPLAFGFDEAGDRKSLALVTLGDGDPDVELLATPCPRPLARLRGELDALLTDPQHAAAEHAWVEATVTDRLLPRGAMERLRGRFPHVVKLEHRPPVAADGAPEPASYAARLRDRSELEIAAQFLREVRGGAGGDEQELRLLTRALEAGERSEALR